jgi:hypothetical protein
MRVTDGVERFFQEQEESMSILTRLMTAAAFACVALLATPVQAKEPRDPGVSINFVGAQRTSEVQFAGSCVNRPEGDPLPVVTAELGVWTESGPAQVVSIPIELRPLVRDKTATGDFVFSGRVLLGDHFPEDGVLSGHFNFASDGCPELSVTLHVGGIPNPYVARAARARRR